MRHVELARVRLEVVEEALEVVRRKVLLATITIGVPAASPIGTKSLVGSYLRFG
jgi:hypothetical protein